MSVQRVPNGRKEMRVDERMIKMGGKYRGRCWMKGGRHG